MSRPHQPQDQSVKCGKMETNAGPTTAAVPGGGAQPPTLHAVADTLSGHVNALRSAISCIAVDEDGNLGPLHALQALETATSRFRGALPQLWSGDTSLAAGTPLNVKSVWMAACNIWVQH